MVTSRNILKILIGFYFCNISYITYGIDLGWPLSEVAHFKVIINLIILFDKPKMTKTINLRLQDFRKIDICI